MRTGEASQVAIAVVCGLAGLVVGSFLNVVAYRVPRHLSLVRPPSRCTACDAELGALDLVPVVSWLALRGRCRRCRVPISARYPLVELATGVTFAGMAVALGSLAPLPPVLAVVACALVASDMDADETVVPRPVVLVAGAAGLALGAVAVALHQPGRIGWAAFGGALAGACALVADRSQGAGRRRSAAVVATVGLAAGWLWPGGGPLVAAWVVVATAATAAGSGRRAPLAVLSAGGYCMMVTGAVLARA